MRFSTHPLFIFFVGKSKNYSSVLMGAEFNGSSPSISFQHLTAILRPTFTVDGSSVNSTITKIVMGNVVFPTTANLAIDDITIIPTSSATTLAFDIYIHLPVMPQYVADYEFAFSVTANGKDYTGSLTIPTGMSIEAGKIYTATIALAEVSVANYVWTSNIGASTSVEGEGTDASPYLIQSANDLQWMINQVNNAAPHPSAMADDEGSALQIPCYRLAHDLEIDSNAGATWTPIGTSASPFVGYFDGGGYTISGEMVTASNVVDAGFFGYAGVGAVITNRTNAADVTSLAQGLETCCVGGIVGTAMGFDLVNWQSNSTYIIACHNTGTITNGTGMTEYSATGGIAGSILCGTCVLACSNTGDLADNDLDYDILVGGVVGLGVGDETNPSIVSCLTNKGAIAGEDEGLIQRANYSTDSDYSGEDFYASAYTEELVNGTDGLNIWIGAFNSWNYDYTSITGTGRNIICNWHWELGGNNNLPVLVEGAPQGEPGT